MSENLNFEDIKKIIPHRHPFILIDAVENLIINESAVGIKCVSGGDPVFQGHFPNKAVFPGVLIIEAMAQTCVVLLNKSLGNVKELYKESTSYFASLDNAKFRKKVFPGEKIIIEVKKIAERRNIWSFECKSYSNGILNAEAKLKAISITE